MTEQLDFTKMTDKELLQEFNYWVRIAKYRMEVFRDYLGTELEDRTYKDYQKADQNAQTAYLVMKEKGLSKNGKNN